MESALASTKSYYSLNSQHEMRWEDVVLLNTTEQSKSCTSIQTHCRGPDLPGLGFRVAGRHTGNLV